MGADIELRNRREIGDEPIADIHVNGKTLTGVNVPEELVPLSIDEFPVIFVAAASAQGTTRISGASELRVKESDRIAVMADGLRQLGVDAEPTDDGMIVNGGHEFGGARIDSHGDHRIAMAFTIAGLNARSPIHLTGCGAIATSFPNFIELVRGCGMNVSG